MLTTIHRNTYHFEGIYFVTDDKLSALSIHVDNKVLNLSLDNLFRGSQMNAILRFFSSGHRIVNNSTDM